MAQPMIINHHNTQDFQKTDAVIIIVKNNFPAIPMRHDMMQRMRKL